MFATGPKVTLRRFQSGDLDAFLAYRADPHVAEFQSWEPMDRKRAKGFIAHMEKLPTLFVPGDWTQIALADPVSNQLLGDMGLHLSPDETEAELGITLARENHRKGIATDAMRLAIDLAFEQTKASQILAGADARNTASLALIEKLGFVFDRVEPPVGAPKGTPATDKIYLLRRTDIAPT